MVLKYYRYGDLHNYILNGKKQKSVPVEYSLKIAFDLGKRICLALDLMHSKGYIHNDIKLGNILLDGDDEELLFPVICDFGLILVLNSASVIKGFNVKQLMAGTFEYCAPEVLKAMDKDIRVSNCKTDVYSLGIVLIELFTRKVAWKRHSVDFVVGGGFPDISVKKFIDNFPNIQQGKAILLVRLFLECVEFDPNKRPTTIEIMESLEKIERNN